MFDSKWYRDKKDKIRIISRLIDRDGLRCKHPDCGLPMMGGDITVDHIIPVSKGGSRRALKNLQLMHLRCNQKKGNGDSLSSENRRSKLSRIVIEFNAISKGNS